MGACNSKKISKNQNSIENHIDNIQNIHHNENIEKEKEQNYSDLNQDQLIELLGIDLQAPTQVFTGNYLQQNQDLSEPLSDSNNNNTQTISEFANELIYLEPLGQGAFGKVHKVFSKKTGKFYAIKTLHQGTNLDEKKKAMEELNIMKQLNQLKSPNIIQLVSINSITKEQQYGQENNENIIMESGSCTLRDILNAGRTYSDAEIQSFLYDICIALNQCYRIRIAHLDLKPENLILNQFYNNYIISDFGEAVILPQDSDKTETYFVGTPSYMSNEM